MKKVLLVCFVVALALCTTLNAFAGVQCIDMNFSACEEGTFLNGTESTSILTMRQDFTAARSKDDSYVRNEECVVISDPIADGELVGKFVAPEYIYTEDDSSLIGEDSWTFNLRKGETNGFNGAIFMYGDDKLNVGTSVSKKTDYYYTEYPAASTADQSYVLASGLGFTFLKANDTTIRFFARCFNDQGKLDVIYYDVDCNTDLTKEYIDVTIYYTLDGLIYFGINEKLACSFEYDLGDEATVSETDGDVAFNNEYCRNVKICDGNGNQVAKTTKGLVGVTGGRIATVFAQAGTGTTCYLYNIAYEAAAEVPEEVFNGIVPYTPNPDATATPAPATATPAPATDAPATEAPATEAPATEAPAEKSGCGSMIATTTIAIVALGAFVIAKRKEN